MRDLVITENITLDGVIEAREGWFAPAGSDAPDQPDMADLEAALRTQREAADAFLVGRVTFEEMRGFWPHVEDDTSGTSAYLDAVSKYVVTAGLPDPGWDRTTVLSGLTDVAALRASEGGDIVVTGSITLTRALITEHLVDEYRLFVHPVVLGNGRRLFADGRSGSGLRLTGSRSFDCGVVLLTYRTR